MSNIIGNHIRKTEKKLKRYCSIILRQKYDFQIATELIKTYIDGRYYNYFENAQSKIFYKNLQDAVINRGEELKEKNSDKTEKIELTVALFPYFFYFDYVRNNVSIQEIIQEIDDKRRNKFAIKNADKDDFILEFTELVISDLKEVEQELEKYGTNDFELKIKRVNPKNNKIYEVALDYNFKFPQIFSKEAVDLTFNTDIIAEDKLFVEYPMVANVALIDILQANFSKIYFVEFYAPLLKKKKKLEQTLEILENQAAQDKIYFKIEYEEFVKSKKEVFELIKRGFRFVLVTNSGMEKLSRDELKILEVFDYILANNFDVNKKSYNKNKIIVK